MNIKKLLITGAAGAILFGSLAVGVFAVGNNGNFETGIDPGSYNTLTAPNITNITNWSVDSGSVDYIGTYWTGSNGSRSVDMNGFAAGSISQTLTTIPGATYTVTFDLSGNPDSRIDTGDTYYSPSDKVLRAIATGATFKDYSYNTSVEQNTLLDMRWKSNAYSFVATVSNTTLTFASQIGGAFGPALDNVAVTETLPMVATCPKGTIQSSLLETVTVPANKNTDTSSLKPLVSGTNYVLKARGTACAEENTSGSCTIYFDADYSKTPALDGSNWVDGVTNYSIYTTDLLDLKVNGIFVNWGSFSSSNDYAYSITGDDNNAVFRIYDVYYTNNTGNLSVDIYSCNQIPTDKNQCKKDGWKNLVGANGNPFKNQGDCVSYVATGGKNLPAGQ